MILRGLTVLLALAFGLTASWHWYLSQDLKRLDAYQTQRKGFCLDETTRENCLTALAAAVNDSSLCSGNAECLAELSETWGDAGSCVGATDEKLCIDHYVVLAGVAAKCDSPKLSDVLRAQCEDALRLRERDAPTHHCAALAGDERSDCLEKNALDTLSVPMCRTLPDNRKDACLAALAPSFAPHVGFDICKEIETPELQRECFFSQAERQPSLCGTMDEQQEECLRNVSRIPIEECELLPHDLVDLCVELAAFRSRRPDYCRRLKKAQQVDGCLATAFRSPTSCAELYEPSLVKICESSALDAEGYLLP